LQEFAQEKLKVNIGREIDRLLKGH
jgi:hypothetical protein